MGGVQMLHKPVRVEDMHRAINGQLQSIVLASS